MQATSPVGSPRHDRARVGRAGYQARPVGTAGIARPRFLERPPGLGPRLPDRRFRPCSTRSPACSSRQTRWATNAATNGQHEARHPVEPDLRAVAQPEEHEDAVGGAGEEDQSTHVSTPTPMAVRHGRVARPVEQVVERPVAPTRRSRSGQGRGSRRREREQHPAPERVRHERVVADRESQPGISRSAPISQPRYQSGCAPFVER